jgi:hypothetical protein
MKLIRNAECDSLCSLLTVSARAPTLSVEELCARLTGSNCTCWNRSESIASRTSSACSMN